MCGICGYVNLGPEGASLDPEVLEAMKDRIVHRGPDGHGSALLDRAALGMRRLAIIDVEGGDQPIYSESGELVIVFNGEVYNFQSLRPALEAKGHKFGTRSDTEVVLHLYEEEGEASLQRLNGMFALAVWDRRNQELFLARDRMGKKPLYYALTPRSFVFASELKSLLAHPDVKPELDFDALNQYLTYEYVPAPRTIFKGVQKLPAGHCLIVSGDGRISVRSYWDIPASAPVQANERELLARFDELLRESVRLRLISDVPLGLFLSGGIDSSTVAYYMAKLSRGPVRSFAIGFQDPSFDESAHARAVAGQLGLDHHEDVLEASQVWELLPRVAQILDEPMADASIFPTYLLSKFTRQHVTVALGGDGGDELLMGYETFPAHRLAQYLDVLPSPVLGLMRAAAGLLPTSLDNMSFDFRAKRLLNGMEYPAEMRALMWLATFPPQKSDLLSAQAWEQTEEASALAPTLAHLRRVADRGIDDKVVYLYLKHYLQDDILVKVDRASMATSLEVRAPLLDVNVVEFLCSLPTRYKLRRFTRKYLLRELMRDRLPPGIADRPKKGFGIPLAKWFRSELRELLLEMLDPRRLERDGIFNAQYVRHLVEDHLEGRRDNRKELWTLTVFQLWRERWLAVPPVPTAAFVHASGGPIER
ncbi:MAG TPA: asparagine synthase (glutamine-hydrolyzing) [Dehalococcoidia bacterium]|nr:asparagine synthase (glutamine-hydrolyzing) [Dehalococcoidia bacterium]